MRRGSKNCGNCRFSVKLTDWMLCDLRDRRGKSDTGHKCPDWKAKRYKRKSRDAEAAKEK
jgi:hypothetical protein